MERTAMSRKEFDRGAVFERVVRGELTLKDAAALLKVSYRQAKRLYKRFRAEGPTGLVHRSVGRVSNHAHPVVDRERVLDLIREHYGGGTKRGPGQRFGPTLVAEHLREDHELLVPVSTLRDWMLEAGLWSRSRRSRTKAKRRERRAHFGELVQFDGSFHDWFEGRGERGGRRSCAMNMVDDATGTTLLRFGEQETIWAAADIAARVDREVRGSTGAVYGLEECVQAPADERGGSSGRGRPYALRAHVREARDRDHRGVDSAGEGAGGTQQRDAAGPSDQEDAAAGHRR
jgi:transposase